MPTGRISPAPATLEAIPPNHSIKKLPSVAQKYTIPGMVYEAKDETSREALNHRLNRIMGQLEGLKKRVASGESDCVADMGQIKAIRNALWKFAEAYVAVHMAECVAQKKPVTEMRDNLQSVIQAAFSI